MEAEGEHDVCANGVFITYEVDDCAVSPLGTLAIGPSCELSVYKHIITVTHMYTSPIIIDIPVSERRLEGLGNVGDETGLRRVGILFGFS